LYNEASGREPNEAKKIVGNYGRVLGGGKTTRLSWTAKRCTERGLAAAARPRKALEGRFYVMRIGTQWKALPKEFGASSSIHRYFRY